MLSACSLTTRHKQAQRVAAAQAPTVPTPAPAASPAPVPDGDFGLLQTHGSGLFPTKGKRLLVLLHRSWSPTPGVTASLWSTTRGYSGSFPLSDRREHACPKLRVRTSRSSWGDTWGARRGRACLTTRTAGFPAVTPRWSRTASLRVPPAPRPRRHVVAPSPSPRTQPWFHSHKISGQD